MGVKSFRILALAAVVGLVFIAAIPGIAQSVSRTVVLSREATLGGKVMAPGRYTLVFDKDKEGEVVLSKDGREVSKVSYKLSELTKEASDSAVVFGAAPDGSLAIRRIEVKGMKTALQFQ